MLCNVIQLLASQYAKQLTGFRVTVIPLLCFDGTVTSDKHEPIIIMLINPSVFISHIGIGTQLAQSQIV